MTTTSLKSINELAELPFYEQLSLIKTNHAFKGYTMWYKVEIFEKKDPIVQLKASKSIIKELFSDLLNETKAFKYQITVKILLKKKKYRHNGEIEFVPVYCNSITKTVINQDLAGVLNQLSLSTLTFRLMAHYQDVLT